MSLDLSPFTFRHDVINGSCQDSCDLLMSLEFPEYSRSTTIQCALPDPALGVVGWKTTGASFFVPTTARGNRRNRPIDLGSLCPDSANRVHVKFGRRFRHVPPVIAAEILCMSKSSRPFRHARPMQWCEVGVHTVPDIRSRCS